MATEENDPELATNTLWREEMILARKTAGLTQEQLGDRIGATQVSISKIESGENESSRFVMPICRVLKIAAPEHYASAEDRDFQREISKLRRENPEQYRSLVALVHSIAVGGKR